ncbi:MAG: hypothetical protein L6R42_009438 [Xanthoria sp. 1 TBL-2021]|nr:MAG: hypothetical protein L6R42_009438 [Xanthoria sp. 1 TBL-2021]
MTKTSGGPALKAHKVAEDEKFPIHLLVLPADTLQKLQLLETSTSSLSVAAYHNLYMDLWDLSREILQHQAKWVAIQRCIEWRTAAIEIEVLRHSYGDNDDWAGLFAENLRGVAAKVGRATARLTELRIDVHKRLEEIFPE